MTTPAATCSCEVVSHPSGDVWTTRSTTPCPQQHRHGQPWRNETTEEPTT